MYGNGLYFFDTNNTDYFVKNKSQVSNYSLLQTVTDNKTYFSKQEIKGADTSREMQEYLFYPGTKTLENYVSQNLITNCEITANDVNHAELIYGTPIPYLQGNMVRRKPPIHEKVEKIPLLPMIAAHHLKISLSVDFLSMEIYSSTPSQKVLISLLLNTVLPGSSRL